jgi:hypothetical protein
MDGSDVARDIEELRPRVEPFLGPDEQLQVVLRASPRPPMGAKVAAATVWPFFREEDRILLVATDRRWLVLESAKERFRGELTQRAELARAIRVGTSWTSRFAGFDRPYGIDPVWELWAVAANDALDAREAGRPWDLESAAPSLTPERGDEAAEKLARVAMKVGRFVPRRRGKA